MEAKKVKTFMQLASQKVTNSVDLNDPRKRELGARLLLSEVLEYCIRGLGLELRVGDCVISDPESVQYLAKKDPDPTESLDGLADVAYTMYWNCLAFGLPLEQAFDLVCDNNLEKFVLLENWQQGELRLSDQQWHCGKSVVWPKEVVSVDVVKVSDQYYAVGKDINGKVRKPSTYRSVDLSELIA